MPNQSKVNDMRFWRKWHASGAVKQPDLKPEDLKIVAVARHFIGLGAGYSVLSLGEKRIGPNCTAPTNYMAVPSHNFKPGQQLEKRPVGAIPLHLLFGKKYQ